MDLTFLLRGLLIGFSIAAPVGPIGVLCIRRTLADGRAAGLVSGLGAATADAIYGSVAAFGLTIISSFLLGQRLWLGLIGGLFLCYLGLRTFLAPPAQQAPPSERAAAESGGGLAGAYGSTFFLTLTNPMTILSFVAIFAGLGLASAEHDYSTAAVLVTGVFSGSALWWLGLSSGINLLRARFTPGSLRWVNRLSGIVIGGFGLFAIASMAM